MTVEEPVTTERFQAMLDDFLEHQGVEAASHFLDLTVDGVDCRTHVLLAGPDDAPPVVLIHGGRSLGAEWAPLMARLQDDYRLIVPDYPGRGLTEKLNFRRVDFRAAAVDFVDGLLDGLDLESVDLVGNSMGGYFGIAYALAAPERVDRLALVGAPAGIDKWVPPFRRLMGVPGVNWLIANTVGRTTREGLREAYDAASMADASTLSEEWLDFKYASQVLPGVQKSWYTALEALITLRGFADRYYLRDELPDVAVPTLFVWGTEDAFAPPESGRNAVEVMPDARIEVLEDVGHIVWLDAPDECARLLSAFFD